MCHPAQFELPDGSDASSKPLGTSRLLEILKKSKQSKRSCSFDAPPEQSTPGGPHGTSSGAAGGMPQPLPYVTIEHLVRSIAAFEEGHGTPEERRRWTLVDLDPVEAADDPSSECFPRQFKGDGDGGKARDPRLGHPAYKHATTAGGYCVGDWLRRPGGGWVRRADAAVSGAHPMEAAEEATPREQQRNGPTFQLVWVKKRVQAEHSLV